MSTSANIAKGREALSAALVCAERLEEAEVLVAQRRLLAGVRALRRLESAAQLGVVETSLGTYVLADRVPRLRMTVMDGAMAQVNDWLMTIRRGSARLGAIAMGLYTRQQQLASAGGGARRAVVYGPEDDDWHIEMAAPPRRAQDSQQAAEAAPAPPTWAAALTAALQRESDLLVHIASGASIQQVFEECGQGAVFQDNKHASRKRQFEVDVVQRTGGATAARDGVGIDGDVSDEHDVFSIALGFILVEDTVNSVTNPAAHSDAQLLSLWQMVSAALVEHVAHLEQQVFLNIRRDFGGSGATTATDVVDPYERAVMTLIAKLQHFITVVHTQLRGSVEFDFGGIAAILETLVNRLHSKWTQDCCGTVAGLLAVDAVSPLRCASGAEYDEFVTRFELHRLRALCLPTFRAEAVYLPFSSSLPPIGRA
ncbi:MAG: hypothetical protein Q8J97_09990, partial [Flavobacteriaceae bacterium]|nr:hypothetical protein [Flavobacteriaceae bacterium]